jgi:hypothetical protein
MSMRTLFVFGLGYTASRLGAHLSEQGWHIVGTGRGGDVSFADRSAVAHALSSATHILSSVPPEGNDDPVLTSYGDEIRHFPGWIGYLSSTGVYGDTRGAWWTKAHRSVRVGAPDALPRISNGKRLAPASSVCLASMAPADHRSTEWLPAQRIGSTCLAKCSAVSMSMISRRASSPVSMLRQASIILPTICRAARMP